jgi:hypothetical protein
MIDPLISLSFAIHKAKGVYALLLGSGVSRAAGIPTGWEVVVDLIRQVAKAYGEECEPDPELWFQKKFGKQPDYSKLLNVLGKTAGERNQILKGYFEPTDEERERGLKLPTVAHKEIAGLVASGHIKVILTTNFDHLLESALRAVNVNPTVISTPDAAIGAIPLAHNSCTIVKFHGDYLDTRIKNTPDELASYKRPMNRLLDRILDEYGLIVCGWSAECCFWRAATMKFDGPYRRASRCVHAAQTFRQFAEHGGPALPVTKTNPPGTIRVFKDICDQPLL